MITFILYNTNVHRIGHITYKIYSILLNASSGVVRSTREYVFNVILRLLCPNLSEIILIFTSLSCSSVAWVWRKSWKRTLGTAAALWTSAFFYSVKYGNTENIFYTFIKKEDFLGNFSFQNLPIFLTIYRNVLWE